MEQDRLWKLKYDQITSDREYDNWMKQQQYSAAAKDWIKSAMPVHTDIDDLLKQSGFLGERYLDKRLTSSKDISCPLISMVWG